MQWGKSKNNKNNIVVNNEQQKYAKDEMYLWLDGTTALAAAIVKQWIEDGMPEDESGIIGIAMDVLELYRKKHQ